MTHIVKSKVCFLFFGIFHYIFYPAGKDFAKHINSVGADAFVSFESGYLPRAYLMLFYQGVLGNAFFFH